MLFFGYCALAMHSGTPWRRMVVSSTGQVSISVIRAARGRTRRINRRTAQPSSSGT
jgi:hypothetical protein